MKKNNIINVGKEVIKTELIGINKLYKSIDTSFEKAVRALSKINGRVIVTGVGKSGHIASKIASTMSSTGTPSQYCSPTDMSHGDLGILSNNDAIVIISNSGNSDELTSILKFAKTYSVLTIGISSNKKSELVKSSDIALLTPNSKEACSIGLAPTTSTSIALILGDALSVALMNLKKFKLTDYKKYHPAGSLGAKMLQVKDIMHKKSKMPIVSSNASMKIILIEITKKSLGHVGVINKKDELIGIITDGDLRRNMNKNFMSLTAKDIMTLNPKLINEKDLMLEALKVMHANKITCLFVVGKNSKKIPIGILHIHDCLRYAD